jgi:predicted aconitase with swiveling domain
MLTLLMLVGFVGCIASVDKTPSIINDLSELDLSDSASEVLAIGATNGTSAFTYVGLGLFAVGSVSFAFIARDAGLKLMACGALAGAIPFVVESTYFSIIVSGALLLSLLIVVYHLWWKVRQNENAQEEQKP